MNINLAEGYIIKSDVNGKYTWVVKLTRLYGEHIMSLTSQTLFSLPVYTCTFYTSDAAADLPSLLPG